MMKWKHFQHWGMHNLAYGSPQRKALTIAKLLALGSLALVGAAAATALVRKLTARQLG